MLAIATVETVSVYTGHHINGRQSIIRTQCTSVKEKKNSYSTIPSMLSIVYVCPNHLSDANGSDKRAEYKLPLKISCARCHSPICDEGRKMLLMFPGLIEFDQNLLPGPFRA